MCKPTWNLDTKKATENRRDCCKEQVEISCDAACGNKRTATVELPHPSKKRKLNPLQLDETLDELSREIPMVSDWENILQGWDSEEEGHICCNEGD
mmetsp:Transcript_15593/g.23619  ORF Transcript_15593/g.23619 Transcript_15593/m.23619 type:complete len:96 (+) Transcript_15593:117-404(+)|eukprot:CAMPEP_0178901588 /NCGR_PEP_ID=MMETSP0786-20121207/4114_1 /TAXON_ID=186022 /ORGANISM="Thalassionema frauenfeldii, Strain CCMP 1798" /LENGTH=95 /DNA_ID=CAMNT_0020572723 /DNA_START=106 /DNA_END=393 /DNA_ORIENTATION=-